MKVFQLCMFIALALLIVSSNGMMPGMGGGKKKDKAPAVKSDIKYIKCSVCEEIVKFLHREVKKMRDELPKNKKLAEFDILEMTEKVCDPEKEEGEWITFLDMVEDGDKIKLVTRERPGKCKKECRTIARACEEIMDSADTELGELLFKGEMQRAKLSNELCRELSNACSKPAPKVKKDRKPIEEFEEMSEKDVEMDKLMKSMSGMPGMPGMEMYSRDDLAGMMDGYGGMDGYGDYDGDEDDAAGGMGGYGDYDEAFDGMADGEPAASVQEKIFEGIDTAAEVVTSGISKAVEGAAKVGEMVTGLFQGKKDGEAEGSAEL
uniref:Saposin B-type domain-containing protein n=1 Tax=Pyramimonas obovata TaxID=1411642 RepID=A0A7S0R519_9CHLO|eukprot:CAMPEP_0118921076 /NCGR_PEP_ID=MMETSP1169-20130426/466_1 /TAXON_ID=36882 /ORGANISM="Pyramimonas obovata, Strain CCMP722" /LENGTH=319 /DNA_ID=CAMNT_0006861733 /DNA_START=48 /DNA_END=1007 /DNA_ORIENTATION=+